MSGDDLGLSSLHISPAQHFAEVPIGGSLLTLRSEFGVDERKRGGKRREIGAFSRSSRRRLLRLMASINQEVAGLPLFITLTYPASWPGTPKIWKRHLDTFLKRLRRGMPESWGIWKLEPQRRGAPHYHLLVWGVDRIEKDWLSHAWFHVVGSGDDNHLRAGTQVQKAQSWRHATHYAAKYVAKVVERPDSSWDAPGRWWGRFGLSLFPIDVESIRLRPCEFFHLRRVLRVYLRKKVGRRRAYRGGLDGASAFLSNEDSVRLLRWTEELPPF